MTILVAAFKNLLVLMNIGTILMYAPDPHLGAVPVPANKGYYLI